MPDLREQLQASLSGSYEIQRELGGGGMSRVFVARETALDRDVVIKVLSSELAVGLSADRFAREITVAARLQEPHILPVLTAGVTSDGLPYYVMPYVRGESLRSRISRERLSLGEGTSVLRDVAEALAYAHEHGVVHRDIKPENILLSSRTAVVADFGIAKAIRVARATNDDASTSAAPTLTSVGTSLGTPAYMAPEQAVGDNVDQRADLYSWGVVAYELLSGRHPFAEATTAQTMIAAQIAQQPIPLRTAAPQLPDAIARLVMRCLEKSPQQRPESARAITDVLSDSPSVETRAPATSSPRMVTIAAVVGFLFIVIAAVVWRRANHTAVGTPERITSVAVLPFVNIGGDPKNDYFSDGMTDELARALTRLPGLRVAGRTSSYAFKGKNVAAAEIGRALDAAGLIEGTVQRAGDRVKISAQLTAAADGKVRWSDSYERPVGDVFAVQDELTRSIVSALEPTLRGAKATALASEARGTTDPEVYDIYLRGQFLWKKRGLENLRTSADLFRDAIRRDSAFARAYSGLALSLGVLPFYAVMNVDSIEQIALESAERAIQIDPNLADAHLARGRALHDLLRLDEAKTEYERALALDPQLVSGHQWLGEILTTRGEADQGLAAERRAARLEPLAAIVGAIFTADLYYTGHVAEAVATGERTVSLDPTLVRPRTFLATALVLAGHADSALRVLPAPTPRVPDEPGAAARYAYVYAALGRWDDVKRLRAELAAQPTDRVNRADVATAALMLGDRETALRELENAVARHEILYMTVVPSCEPMFAPLRKEARFREMLRKMGMKDCPVETTWPIAE